MGTCAAGIDEGANLADGNSEPNSNVPTHFLSLSTAQWITLMNLLNNSNYASSNKLSGMRNLWILDSGCSTHMTGRVDSLWNLNSIYPYTIGFPNGTEAVALHKETVRLSSELTIHNVLLIPDLKCNLIFLPQLARDNYCFTFSDQLCVIQDRTSMRSIGVVAAEWVILL